MTDHNHSDKISDLNTLIATTIDSMNGYENSAKDIDNQRFAEIFRQRANERQSVVEELRSEVRRLGGNPEDDGSFIGKAHQRFEDLKAAITGKDEKSIINEVERGEDYLKGKFETALNSDTLSGELSRRRRAMLSIRAIGPRPDEPAEARHGNRRLSEKGRSSRPPLFQYPISASTSRRLRSSSRNVPIIRLVVIMTPGVETPRAVMQA